MHNRKPGQYIFGNHLHPLHLDNQFYIHHKHGYRIYMDTAYTWIQHTHGYRIHMDTAYTWIQHTHGCRIHMDTAYTWMQDTHGYSIHMGVTDRETFEK